MSDLSLIISMPRADGQVVSTAPTQHGPPIWGTRFNSGDVLQGGVVTNTFVDHVMRKDPSDTPGIDIDRPSPPHPHSENLSPSQKPEVRSPVSGTVIQIKADPWGTVRIIDENGYQHILLHNDLVSPGPLSTSYFDLKLGPISKFDPIGLLDNKHTRRDHVHYYIIAPNGQIIDPLNTLRHPGTGAVLGVDDPLMSELQDHLRRDPEPMHYDDRWESWNRTA